MPCTPAGVLELVKRTGVAIAGKKVVVLGRSNIVGKPAAMLFLRENATVTVCHSRTVNVQQECAQADILVVAVGRPKLVKKYWVKPGAVVIDVGINRVDGKIWASGFVKVACLCQGGVNTDIAMPRKIQSVPLRHSDFTLPFWRAAAVCGR